MTSAARALFDAFLSDRDSPNPLGKRSPTSGRRVEDLAGVDPYGIEVLRLGSGGQQSDREAFAVTHYDVLDTRRELAQQDHPSTEVAELLGGGQG